MIHIFTLLIKTTDEQNEVALSYHRMRGLYSLKVIFSAAELYIRHLDTSLHKFLQCIIFMVFVNILNSPVTTEPILDLIYNLPKPAKFAGIIYTRRNYNIDAIFRRMYNILWC